MYLAQESRVDWWKAKCDVWPCSKISLCHCLWQSQLWRRMEAGHPRGQHPLPVVLQHVEISQWHGHSWREARLHSLPLHWQWLHRTQSQDWVLSRQWEVRAARTRDNVVTFWIKRWIVLGDNPGYTHMDEDVEAVQCYCNRKWKYFIIFVQFSEQVSRRGRATLVNINNFL